MSVHDQIQRAVEAFADSGEYPRWPWPSLNRDLGGLPPGRLTVIGARPGNGKTTVLLNALRRWAWDGVKVFYLGTEQSAEETWQRLAALELGIPPVLVIERRWGEIASSCGKSAAAVEMDVTEAVLSLGRRWGETLFCGELPRLSAPDFLRVSGEAAENGCEIVVLDHVLRLRYDLRSLTAEVGELATEAKELAKSRKIHVVLAAQVSRPPAELGLKAMLTPPRPEQLKQSGALEQEADVVLMLHRVPRDGLTEQDIGQVRSGQREIATLFAPQVLGVTVGKHRLRSHMTDRTFRLHIENWDEIIELTRREREPGEEPITSESPF